MARKKKVEEPVEEIVQEAPVEAPVEKKPEKKKPVKGRYVETVSHGARRMIFVKDE